MNYQETIERMHSGRLYYCDNEELVQEQLRCLELCMILTRLVH